MSIDIDDIDGPMGIEDPYKRLAIYLEEAATGGAFNPTPVRFYERLPLSRKGNFLCNVLTLPPAQSALPVFCDEARIRFHRGIIEWFQLELPCGGVYRITEDRIYADDDLVAIDSFLAERGL